MAIADKLKEQLSKLPEPLQIEVLDFTEYLLKKLAQQERHEYLSWGDLSLRQALRGMEDEPAPDYSIADLNVVFK